MNKNILVITGSPRKGGNSDLLADAFIKGATQAGNKVTKIESASLKISGCKACDGCYKKGVPCCVGDDFNKVAPLIEEAEVIVFATPLYWYSFSSQIKMVIDKFHSFFIGEKNVGNKESILLLCGSESEESAYEGILTSYTKTIGILNWTNKAKLVIKGIVDKGAIKDSDGLAKAEEIGMNI